MTPEIKASVENTLDRWLEKLGPEVVSIVEKWAQAPIVVPTEEAQVTLEESGGETSKKIPVEARVTAAIEEYHAKKKTKKKLKGKKGE